MEWIGTGFVLTIGGVRLRVRIALEDTPEKGPLVRRAGGRARGASWRHLIDGPVQRDGERGG